MSKAIFHRCYKKNKTTMNKNICFECSNKATFDHHVIPKEFGGTKTIPLCSDCHGKVHDKDLTSMKVLRDQSAVKKYEKGIFPAGIPPLGYKWAGKRPNKYLVINPDTKPIVEFIFANYKKTKSKFYSLRGLQKSVFENFGWKLTPQGIRSILTNDFYIGKVSYGNRPKIDGIHEIFITKNRFTRTQNKLNS